eukprot:Gb_12948 [translate_table: standard]
MHRCNGPNQRHHRGKRKLKDYELELGRKPRISDALESTCQDWLADMDTNQEEMQEEIDILEGKLRAAQACIRKMGSIVGEASFQDSHYNFIVAFQGATRGWLSQLTYHVVENVLDMRDFCIVEYDPKDLELDDKLLELYVSWLAKNRKAYIGLGWMRNNLHYIVEQNQKNMPYWLGLNEFADLSHQEFKALCLGTKFDATRRERKALLLLFLFFLGCQDWREDKMEAFVKILPGKGGRGLMLLGGI